MESIHIPVAAHRQPIVFAKNGEILASSRDVADFFEKNHRDVMRVIDGLIEQEPGLTPAQFCAGVYTLPSTGSQQHRMFEITRDGFTLLAMGFTGAKALKWKLRYIEAFNRMEAELRSRPAQIDVRDPSQLATIAIQLIEVNKELETRARTAEGRVEEMRPQVEALDRIAGSEGSYAPTDAAKTIGVQPKELFSYLRGQARWMYRRPGTSEDVAYQDKLQRGLMEHKVTTIHRNDGSEKTVTRARITAKGLAHLATVFQGRLV